MTTWIPVTTTIGIISGQPRKGVDQEAPPVITTPLEQQEPSPSSSTRSSSATRTALPATESSGSAQKDRSNDRHDGMYNWKGNGGGGGKTTLDQTGEHLLIAAGSIGKNTSSIEDKTVL
jgi:hypothetical protein